MGERTDYKKEVGCLYRRFGLVLMVTHGCNLRCSYCYNGPQFESRMSAEVGRRAIDRGIASIQEGGVLELGFFGGEPFLEADLISSLIEYARIRTQRTGLRLCVAITTNGTVTNRTAWSVMMMPEVDLALSIDGRPEIHDRNRCYANGRGSFESILKTLGRLVDDGKDFKAVTVVRPDSVETLADEVMYLRCLGIRRIELALDIWTRWDSEAIEHLEQAIVACARLWAMGLPDFSLNWFDDKAAMLTDTAEVSACRCGFGKGDIAVAPSGYLYPCERLIQDDSNTNHMRLPGHILEGEDFLFGPIEEVRTAAACQQCAIRPACNTTCGCCNYVRTGGVGRPDRFLCMFNQWCLRETQAALEEMIVA
ncbi:MAG: radical SAM protein [Planctomycetota bacterium]|jgi:uncharacterized protein